MEGPETARRRLESVNVADGSDWFVCGCEVGYTCWRNASRMVGPAGCRRESVNRSDWFVGCDDVVVYTCWRKAARIVPVRAALCR